MEPGSGGGVCTRGAEPDSAGLLEAIRRGDAEAFDTVAREVAPRLFRLALGLTGRREEAEDLVQETLVRALPALRHFEGRARLSTYLARSLGNLWKNRLRSRKRSPLVAWLRGDAGESDFDPPGAEPTPLDRLVERDRAGAVRRALASLDPVRRLTLLLREIEGMSYEEIGAATSVPVGTVRSRLARAREELRIVLGDRP